MLNKYLPKDSLQQENQQNQGCKRKGCLRCQMNICLKIVLIA